MEHYITLSTWYKLLYLHSYSKIKYFWLKLFPQFACVQKVCCMYFLFDLYLLPILWETIKKQNKNNVNNINTHPHNRVRKHVINNQLIPSPHSITYCSVQCLNFLIFLSVSGVQHRISAILAHIVRWEGSANEDFGAKRIVLHFLSIYPGNSYTTWIYICSSDNFMTEISCENYPNRSFVSR